MTVKNVVQQIEKLFGRQSEQYMYRLINDALLDMSSRKQHYTVSATTDLKYKQRWYGLSDQVIDITKVEVKDTNSRYVMIPKLADPHKLLRDDTDSGNETLT
jgi:hypothetical protein